ncbi:positive regulator of sigma-B activity [Pontibacillus halophilus JSM 076056 = DSM 19796]|uniref:Anti-sigma factor antagonist n=1 Tax=Pontibacillus halophilus JSM 076056 = DSM 19796 TaxID=1385510 RepID=A0A0A5GH91_9BACI|nr:STAS domain-containing protein [Pontibacillus halophilus]KGX90578.1 positive regulator of sigma-B activity [Pontibacillus halophilus JSM 076056 = DSM 19796]
MNLTIDVANKENENIVSLSGEIDAYTAPKLKETLLPLTKGENTVVTVDLAEVNYMDSTGLGVFISALKSTKETNSELKLINPNDRVMRLFEITGLTEIINIQDESVRGGM